MEIPARIPFADLITPHLELEQELLVAFKAVLRTRTFIGGLIVEDFEEEFARYCGTRYCIGVKSGLDALRLALTGARVKPGDVVLTAANACSATTMAIAQSGALPHLIDVDKRTYSLDPVKLEEHVERCCCVHPMTGKLFDRTTQRPITAVVPLHLYGQTADMDRILGIAERYHLTIVEDAREAHGAEYFSEKQNRWRKSGSMGRAAAFSFDPGANLGACGDAGAITTDDEEVAQEVRVLRDREQSGQYDHACEGGRARLDAIQAGILKVKLGHLSDWNKKRRENAFCYHGLLTPVGDQIIIPYEPSWARATYHSYVIRIDNRDELRSYLRAASIPTKIHCSAVLEKVHRRLRYKPGDFPVAEAIAAKILSLPIYPQLEFDQQHRVAHQILDFVERGKAVRSRDRVLPVFPA
jgi:dTDP-4-amino-4,6-dideoxygalactose transaminase